MFSHRSKHLTRHIALAAAWLVLLVLGMGLSRSLVVCTKTCCGGHVQIAPSECVPAAPVPACSCCKHDARGGRPVKGGGNGTLRSGCSGCDFVALGVELGMPPSDGPAQAPAAVLPPTPAVFAPRCDAEPLAVAHPPATGPPRCDPRTNLLATTILRL